MSAVGKRAKCPACGETVVVQAAAERAAAPVAMSVAMSAALPTAAAPVARPVMAGVAKAPPPLPVRRSEPAEDDGLGALYELAEQANNAAPAPERAQCPQCRNPMADGVVFCTSCGYNAKTGKGTSVAKVAKPAAGKNAKPVDYMAPTGSITLGVILSTVFAVVTSVVWMVVMLATGRTFSLIAILIGAAAGLGMRIGHKGFSATGGYVAAGTTLGAILLAKFLVYQLAVSAHGDFSSAEVGWYFFNPIQLLIMAIGVSAAYKTANGSST